MIVKLKKSLNEFYVYALSIYNFEKKNKISYEFETVEPFLLTLILLSLNLIFSLY